MLALPIILSSALAPSLRMRAMTKSQYVEPAPPKGFQWASTINDMEGVRHTSMADEPAPAKTPTKMAPARSGHLYSAVAVKSDYATPGASAVAVTDAAPVTLPPQIPAPAAASSADDSKMEMSRVAALAASKSTFVLAFCTLTVFGTTSSFSVVARTFSAGSANLLVAMLGLVLKLGWRCGVAFALCSAVRPRLLTSD